MNPPSTFDEIRVDAPPAVPAPTRPLYWSIRREIWENRSIWLGPLIVASVVLFGFVVSSFTLPREMRGLAALDPAKQREAVTTPYSAASFMPLLTAFLVGVFYCLDALQGERRDRSILFWKSLPVSDRTAVLSKAAIPMVVLPMIVFVVAVTTHILMLLWSHVVLLGSGTGVGMLWKHLKYFQFMLAFLYGVIIIALWHAPVYAWLLLISGWARRTAFLWAVLPMLVVFAVERIVFKTSNMAKLVGYRLIGFFQQGFVFPPKGSKEAVDPLAHLAPAKYFTTPGLWVGLLLAALFLAAAVRLRRHREPA